MKRWLEKNAIEMYSTNNEGKFVVAERFIRTLKNKMYKYMASISKNVYIDIFNDIVNKYNNTYHSTRKMKPLDLNQTYILTLVKKLMIKILNLKLVISLEYQNIQTFLQKAMFQIFEQVFVIKKAKNIVLWTFVISNLNGEKTVGTFYGKELQKQIKKSLDLKK